MKRLFVLLILFFLATLFSKSIYAQDFRSDYTVEYNVREQQTQLLTEVKFNIKITHLKSDVFVKKFSLIFPEFFTIKDVTASDDRGAIVPKTSNEDQKIKIELEFNDPQTGKGSINNFYLNFTQTNLFKINGNIWEVILPTIENRGEGEYNVIVNLPSANTKKISFAKPIPAYITGKKLTWTNPKTKTIYAVFGDNQFYETKLNYNLANPKLVPVYTDVAFPPDTLYQKIYLQNLFPMPSKIFQDEDGNFIGRYYLKPRENRTVSFNGVIEVTSRPRSEFQQYLKNQLPRQEKYLLTEKNYWQVDQPDRFTDLKTVNDIYAFVINNLTYDYSRLTKKNARLGATKALTNPTRAVCTEFTDLFIALAREKGIYSREIEGFGFSNDPQFRPMSFVNDLLHAWPEYYDRDKKIWVAIDPTWENTSGIDYFSSFDLNHIIFVIHGKDPTYPYPAGMYKVEDSKDILIKPTSQQPSEINKVKLQLDGPKNVVYYQKKYSLQLKITNLSNIFLYQQKLSLAAPLMTFDPQTVIVDQLAPFQEKEITINMRPSKVLSKKNTQLTIASDGQKLLTQSYVIFPVYYDLALKFAYGGILLLAIFIILKYAKK